MTATARATANAAQTALVTRLQARDELSDALVQIGLPAEVPNEADRVYVASVDDLTRAGHPAPLALDQGIFQENYTLSVLVESHGTGSSNDDALRAATSDRMWQIVAEIEDELADNPQLAENVDRAWVEAIPAAFTMPATDGWIGKAIVNIHVEALCQLG